MGGKKKYIDMFGSLTEPFNCVGMLRDASTLGVSCVMCITVPATDYSFIL